MKNKSLVAPVALIAFALFSLPACSKKKVKDESNLPSAAFADENPNGDSDSGKAMGLQTVHFSYDSYLFDNEAKDLLKANAQILKDKPRLKIQIEGNCDARGGIQYNIALGEKRATAAKKYLIDLGVDKNRIEVISFGKEKPIATGDTEEAYAKNRRDNFIITAH